jgi:hypothetical protein
MDDLAIGLIVPALRARKKSRETRLSKLTGRRQTEGETALKNPENWMKIRLPIKV